MPLNSWRKWLDRAFGLTRTAPIRRPIRPRLEMLEERWVPAITAVGQAASLVEGAANAVVVATFTDSTPSPAAGYTANINWGDATSSTGAVSLTGATFSVTGTHTYAEETPAGSPHAVTVVITETAGDMDAATATGSAAVSDAPLRVDAGPAFNASEGATASPVLATFTDANPGDHTADFSTAITWGDGSPVDTSSGAVSYDAQTGVYTVTGSHAYVEEGSYFASVRITDVGGFAVDTGVGLNGNGAVVTAASQTAGAWYPDRFPPNGFVGGQTDFGRTGVIDETISAADADGSRPPAFNTSFYDFQGRKYDLPAGTSYVTMDLYVPSSWAGLNQQDPMAANGNNFGSLASLWGTGVDGSSNVTSFPIIGFNNLGTNNGQSGTAGFEVFDQTNGFTNVPGFTGYDQWYQLSIGVSGGNLVYFVNGAQVYTDATVTGTTAISNEILQGYNGGNTYDAFWNPVQDTPATVADQQIQNLSLAAPGFTPLEGGSIGGPFTGVATFTDPAGQGVETAADFSATINWGDGVTDAATVVSDGNGNYHVNIPDHTYADEGAYDLSVTVTHDLLPPVTSNTQILTVNDADTLTAASVQPSITGTEGHAITGNVAVFTDAGYPGNTASDFTATIDWGDGTTDTGTVSGGSGADFTVGGTHAYADEGSFNVIVVLSDDAPGTATGTVTGTATVAEGDFGTLIPATITPTEGTAFSGAVASFTDTGNPLQVASDFTATIDWGDGATTTGTLSGATGGPFTISGSHTYADEGTFAVTATFSDDPPSTLTDIPINSTAVVSDADTLAPVSVQPNATLTEGNATTSDIAVFSDAGYPTNDPGDFTATIDWGDGTTTTGTVSAAGDGNFTVSGSHAYADEGSFTATVVIADDAPGTDSATAANTVTVLDADVLTGTAAPIQTTEGTPFSGTVATFSDAYTGNTASDFTATINWGDGTTTTGTISGGSGAFTVGGSHTYADEGSFAVTVVLSDDAPGTATGTASGMATVADADVLTGTAAPIQTTEGTAFSGTVATFSDAYTGNTAGDFTATINWGDGTTTAGTLSGSGGAFAVSGSHTYADEGSFAVTVVLSDDAPGTATGTASGTATVADADVLSGTAAPIQTMEGTPFSGTVATFSDAYTGNTAGDFTATINWGDGTTTAGTVSGSGGAFAVSGSHTYMAGGSFNVSVTLADDAPGTASATATTTASDGGDVVITDTTGGKNLRVFRSAPGGPVGSITYILGSNPPVTLTGVHSFTYNGQGAGDSMTVDYVNGEPLVAAGLFFNGGQPTQTLTVDDGGQSLPLRTPKGFITAGDISPETTAYTGTSGLLLDNAPTVDAFAGPDTADRATAFIGLNAQERAVQALYLDALGRAGSKGELDGWVSVLPAGATSLTAQVVDGIEHSQEARDHLVKAWYVAFLGRQAQGGEEQGFVNLLQAGQTEEQALSLILGSAEFYARAQTLFGTANADENYVRALYLVLLDRPASSGEAAGLTAAVAQLGRTNLARAFLTSQEFRTDDFEGYYNALLHRPDDPNGLDPAGLSGWVFSNLDVGSVRVAFESSAEFFVDG